MLKTQICVTRPQCVNERVNDAVVYTRFLCEEMGVQYFLIFTTPLVKFKSFLGFEAVSSGN